MESSLGKQTHSARLIHITPACEGVIAYCCRVTNPANQDNEEFARLLTACIRHREWSVLEMAGACFEITTTRAIAPQILRHRSFSFQEFSQRWGVVQEPIHVGEIRKRGEHKYNSTQDPLLQNRYRVKQEKLFKDAAFLYRDMLDDGVHPECARDVLPLASPTRLYMHGTIRSWYHYLEARREWKSQKEHRMIADQIYEELRKHLPVVMSTMQA